MELRRYEFQENNFAITFLCHTHRRERGVPTHEKRNMIGGTIMALWRTYRRRRREALHPSLSHWRVTQNRGFVAQLRWKNFHVPESHSFDLIIKGVIATFFRTVCHIPDQNLTFSTNNSFIKWKQYSSSISTSLRLCLMTNLTLWPILPMANLTLWLILSNDQSYLITNLTVMTNLI